MGIRRVQGILLLLALLPLSGMGQSVQKADSLFKVGKDFDNRGKMKQSKYYYRKAYHLYKELQDTASWLQAGKEYGSALVYASKTDSAMQMYSKLVEVDHPANDAYNRGDIYNSMGWAYNRIGRTDSALKYYNKSLPLSEASGDSLLVGVIYDNLGSTFYQQANYSKALEYSQKALPYLEGLGLKNNTSITISNIAHIYTELGLYENALRYYKKSLELQKEFNNVNNLAAIYRGIGHAQKESGNYDQALISYTKSLEYSRQSGDKAKVASILNNIGLLYKNLGEYEKALEYYNESLAIKRAADIQNPNFLSSTIRNLGHLYWVMEDIDNAEKYFKEALALRKEYGNPLQIAASLNNMAMLAIQKNNFAGAKAYTDEIFAIGDSTGSIKTLGNANQFYGKIYAKQGQNEKALSYFRKEYNFSKEIGTTEQLESLRRLARQFDAMDSDSAVYYGEKAINLIEEHRTNVGMVSDIKASFLKQYSDFYIEVASWFLTYSDDKNGAFHRMEQAKARALSDELLKARKDVSSSLPDSVQIERRKKKQRIDSLYTALEITSSSEKRNEIQNRIKEEELEYASFENSLQQKFPLLESLQLPEAITLEDARQLLDPKTAVLEYAISKNHLIIYFISSDEVKTHQFTFSDGEAVDKKLTDLVSQYKSSILSNIPIGQLRPASNKLYDRLLAPFEEEISNYENLLIVPDGALAYLPFEALIAGDRYLVQNYNIKYEPSLTSLTLLQSPDNGSYSGELLAVAASDFSTSKKNRLFRGNNLSTLPSTLMEVDSIATKFSNPTVMKDDELSEAEFKEVINNNSYRYIHLATHGMIDENNPARSGLVLSGDSSLTASQLDDGMLRSSEIMSLNLNTDMVVLSACNTGLGELVDGEGILGMQRSFFQAGASSVVVSLWNIYDRSTASFMNNFYTSIKSYEQKEGWIDGMMRWVGWKKRAIFGPKDKALRRAKLKMIEHPLFNNPVYWAPFVMIGK